MGTLVPILMMISAYLVGSIPFGLVIGKLKGIDIREHGSHNIGATNALRTLGIGYGLLVFVLDFVKGGIFVFLTKYVISYQMDFFTLTIHPLIYGIIAILGHLFPVYLKFKGGKGISCFAGVMIAYSLPVSGIALAVFILVFVISRYVSLSSTLSALSLFLAYFILRTNDIPLLIFISIAFILVVIKHIPNYKRLIKGTENKISFRKKEKKSK